MRTNIQKKSGVLIARQSNAREVRSQLVEQNGSSFRREGSPPLTFRSVRFGTAKLSSAYWYSMIDRVSVVITMKLLSCLLIFASVAISQLAYANVAVDSIQAQLLKRFQQNFIKSNNAYLGISDSQEFRNKLKAAHYAVMSALESHDDEAFNNALLLYMNTNRELAFGSANLAEGFTHGKGPTGSSAATASDGANTGISLWIAYARKNVNNNNIICSYIFGEDSEFWHSYRKNCTYEAGVRLYSDLTHHKVKIRTFLSYVSG